MRALACAVALILADVRSLPQTSRAVQAVLRWDAAQQTCFVTLTLDEAEKVYGAVSLPYAWCKP